MSSKIEIIIDELEEFIENCKPKFMSTSEIVVNKEDIDDYIHNLRVTIPEEIKRYQRIINNKDAILNDAREKAEKLIADATAQTKELISQNEIMRRAYEQADEVVTLANDQAQAILDNATIEANNLRIQATQYTDDRLAEMETILLSAIQNSSANYNNLLSSLTQYKDVIQANRQALNPVEEDIENLEIEDGLESTESDEA